MTIFTWETNEKKNEVKKRWKWFNGTSDQLEGRTWVQERVENGRGDLYEEIISGNMKEKS